MGYEIHVTRREMWCDDEGPEIALEEWLAIIARDPSLRLTGEARAPLAEGGELSYRNEGLAEWTGHSRGEPVWIDFREGRLVVKHPDEEMARKLVSIAEQLGAKVQGDDGAVCTATDFPVATGGAGAGAPRRSFWRRLFGK